MLLQLVVTVKLCPQRTYDSYQTRTKTLLLAWIAASCGCIKDIQLAAIFTYLAPS